MRPRENKRALDSQRLDLSDSIDIREWQKIQDNFSTITGVSVRTLDSEGKLFTKQAISRRCVF